MTAAERSLLMHAADLLRDAAAWTDGDTPTEHAWAEDARKTMRLLRVASGAAKGEAAPDPESQASLAAALEESFATVEEAIHRQRRAGKSQYLGQVMALRTVRRICGPALRAAAAGRRAP